MFSLSQLSPTDPSDLRAAVAFSGLPKYKLAALVGLHSSALSLLLNGQAPIPEAIGKKILKVVQTIRANPPKRGVR